MPDRGIPLYSRDVFARHDPFLAAALADTPPASSVQGSGVLVNGATFRPGPVAPGSLATLFVSLARTSGVEVRFNDTPARLVAVTPNQINLQVPSGIAPGTANLRVLLQGVGSSIHGRSDCVVQPGAFSVGPLARRSAGGDPESGFDSQYSRGTRAAR